MAAQTFLNFIGGASTKFAQISSKATIEANRRRLEVAGANRAAGQAQIDLEERVADRRISQTLSKFQGEQAAARAFRGGGAGGAADSAAAAQAGDEAAIVSANAANKSVALAAQTQVILDDPVQAAIQGGIQGMGFAQQILSSLVESAEVVQRQSSRQVDSFGSAGKTPTFTNTITSILQIPGLDLNKFLSTLNLGVT